MDLVYFIENKDFVLKFYKIEINELSKYSLLGEYSLVLKIVELCNFQSNLGPWL